jgi:hypothetical protein
VDWNLVAQRARRAQFFSFIDAICSVEKIKEWVMRSFDDVSSRRLFNWGRRHAVPPKSNHGRGAVEKGR